MGGRKGRKVREGREYVKEKGRERGRGREGQEGR